MSIWDSGLLDMDEEGGKESLEDLMAQDELELESMLESDEIIQECKHGNKTLISILTKPEVLAILIKYVIMKPSDDKPLEDPSILKFGYVISELFNCKNVSILDALFDNGDKLLELFFSFLEDKTGKGFPVPEDCAYFGKVLNILALTKHKQMCQFITRHPSVLNNLLAALQLDCVMEFLLRVQEPPKDVEQEHIATWDFNVWLNEHKFVQTLVTKLSSASSASSSASSATASSSALVGHRTRENAAQVLVEMVSLHGFPFYTPPLSSSSSSDILSALPSSASLSRHVFPPLLLTLLSEHSIVGLVKTILSPVSDSSRQYSLRVIYALLDWFSKYHRIIVSSPDNNNNSDNNNNNNNNNNNSSSSSGPSSSVSSIPASSILCVSFAAAAAISTCITSTTTEMCISSRFAAYTALLSSSPAVFSSCGLAQEALPALCAPFFSVIATSLLPQLCSLLTLSKDAPSSSTTPPPPPLSSYDNQYSLAYSPLGPFRFLLVRFMHALVACNRKIIATALCDGKIMSSLLTFFQAYPNHTLLHRLIVHTFAMLLAPSSIFTTTTTATTRNSPSSASSAGAPASAEQQFELTQAILANSSLISTLSSLTLPERALKIAETAAIDGVSAAAASLATLKLGNAPTTVIFTVKPGDQAPPLVVASTGKGGIKDYDGMVRKHTGTTPGYWGHVLQLVSIVKDITDTSVTLPSSDAAAATGGSGGDSSRQAKLADALRGHPHGAAWFSFVDSTVNTLVKANSLVVGGGRPTAGDDSDEDDGDDMNSLMRMISGANEDDDEEKDGEDGDYAARRKKRADSGATFKDVKVPKPVDFDDFAALSSGGGPESFLNKKKKGGSKKKNKKGGGEGGAMELSIMDDIAVIVESAPAPAAKMVVSVTPMLASLSTIEDDDSAMWQVTEVSTGFTSPVADAAAEEVGGFGDFGGGREGGGDWANDSWGDDSNPFGSNALNVEGNGGGGGGGDAWPAHEDPFAADPFASTGPSAAAASVSAGDSGSSNPFADMGDDPFADISRRGNNDDTGTSGERGGDHEESELVDAGIEQKNGDGALDFSSAFEAEFDAIASSTPSTSTATATTAAVGSPSSSATIVSKETNAKKKLKVGVVSPVSGSKSKSTMSSKNGKEKEKEKEQEKVVSPTKEKQAVMKEEKVKVSKKEKEKKEAATVAAKELLELEKEKEMDEEERERASGKRRSSVELAGHWFSKSVELSFDSSFSRQLDALELAELQMHKKPTAAKELTKEDEAREKEERQQNASAGWF